jgi:hypothetical protein
MSCEEGSMKLLELMAVMEAAIQRVGEDASTAEVEVWLDREKVLICDVGQFSASPDVVLKCERLLEETGA